MTSREKVLKALDHQNGPLPVDIGSTAITGMHCLIVSRLRDHYGLEKRPVKVHEPYQMLGLLEEDLLEAIGIDVAGMDPLNTLFGFPAADWKPWTAPWGQELLVPGQFNVTTSASGTYIFPEGDTSVPASGHMPNGGFFFDSIIRQPEIVEEELDPDDNLEEFNPMTGEELQKLRVFAEEAAAGGRAVAGGIPGTALGDIAFVPAPFLKHPKGIRDIAEWYMSTVARQDYVHAIFEMQTEIALENLEKAAAEIGSLMDVIVLCGTDFGTQSSTFCSAETYHELWHPYYKKMNDWIHANTSWKVFKHSCGAVESLMENFIASGFDIINPVQTNAEGMDPVHLKEAYGKELTFWGGGVDTQKVLPFGTPEEIRSHVLEKCEIFSRDGGFVFNSVHNIQANVPVGNIVAMIEAVKEFNG